MAGNVVPRNSGELSVGTEEKPWGEGHFDALALAGRSLASVLDALEGYVQNSGNYQHAQLTPSSGWDITHNLGKYPAVSVIDSSGAEVVGDVQHLSTSRLLITFSALFSGNATLN